MKRRARVPRCLALAGGCSTVIWKKSRVWGLEGERGRTCLEALTATVACGEGRAARRGDRIRFGGATRVVRIGARDATRGEKSPPLAVTRTTRGADGTRGARRTARAATGLAADLRAMRTGARAERAGRATTAFIVMVGRAIRCDQNGRPVPGIETPYPWRDSPDESDTRELVPPEFQTNL